MSNRKVKNQASTEADQQAATKELLEVYQKSIDAIRGSRYTVKMTLLGQWESWYNNLATICFSLGGALIAIALVVNEPSRQITFWIGTGLLLGDGALICLKRMRVLELDSIESQNLGYEEEYRLLVVKNILLDSLLGKQLQQDKFEQAKNDVVEAAMRKLNESYSKSGKLDISIDVIITIFAASFGFLLFSALPVDSQTVLTLSILWICLMGVLFGYRAWSPKARAAIRERDGWLEKINKERVR